MDVHRLIHWLSGSNASREEKREEPRASQFSDEGEESVRLDIKRLDRALSSESHKMPPGLSREEKREFILAVANRRR